MDKIVIEGGYKLEGDVKISGSKNAALPILVSALLADGESTFSNVPRLNDITTILSLLESLGVCIRFNRNIVKINPIGLDRYEAPSELVRKMRGSILILSPLIARFKRAMVPLPGGCSIGARPIDFHLKALEQLGVEIKLEGGYINAFTKGLEGADVFFKFATVTGTENIIMAAVLAKGVTRIHNAAREPEIIDLSQVLNSMGAKIKGAGSSEVFIRGVDKLNPVRYSIIPDRIETGTFMIASALTRGNVNIVQCVPENLTCVTHKLRLAGAIVDIEEDSIRVQGSDCILSTDVRTSPYPGFPTDMQAPFMTLMAVSSGMAVICESIFENRLVHARELNSMGADIEVRKNVAVVKGVKSLFGGQVNAGDLRAAASLILAGLVANGQTEISGINHLDRGYELLEEKIEQLGGVIKRVKQ